MEWIIPNTLLSNSPSRKDGLCEDLERTSRAKTTWFIEEMGQEFFKEAKSAARLCVSTACVLFHRFFAFQSFKQHDRFIIAAGALFLATKIEESCIYRSRHLQIMAQTYAVVRKKLNIHMEMELKDVEKKILLAERILLQTLCFDLQVTHPYIPCTNKVKELKLYIPEDFRQQFHQAAINIVNDSYRTSLCLQYSPENIAVAAVFLAALYMGFPPETSRISGAGSGGSSSSGLERTWYELLESDMDEEVLHAICDQMLSAYSFNDAMPGKQELNALRANELRARLAGKAPEGGANGSSGGGGLLTEVMGVGSSSLLVKAESGALYTSPTSISNPPSLPRERTSLTAVGEVVGEKEKGIAFPTTSSNADEDVAAKRQRVE